MDLAVAFFLFLWGLAGGPSGERAPVQPRRPPPPPPPPSSPGATLPPPPSPPWPAVTPVGLPAFPSSAWEFDDPPPIAVQQRAGQLVSPLWKRGRGAYQIEQTAGRWIAYQAQVVASGRNGVVAYRVKQRSASSPGVARRPPPRLPAAPAPAATSPSSAAPRVNVKVGPATIHPPVEVVQARPTLRTGSGMGALEHQSPHVMYVQRVLGVKVVDGNFGPITAKAVDTFQRTNDLKVDGVVGPETWAALDRHPRARALLQA